MWMLGDAYREGETIYNASTVGYASPNPPIEITSYLRLLPLSLNRTGRLATAKYGYGYNTAARRHLIGNW